MLLLSIDRIASLELHLHLWHICSMISGCHGSSAHLSTSYVSLSTYLLELEGVKVELEGVEAVQQEQGQWQLLVLQRQI